MIPMSWTMNVMCPVCNTIMIPREVFKSYDRYNDEWHDIIYEGECKVCGNDLHIAREYKHGKMKGWCVKQAKYYKNNTWKIIDSPYCYRTSNSTQWKKYYQ